MNFISFKNWLFEKESRKTQYGCVMLYTHIPDWEERLKEINREDIYDNAIRDFGLEHNPHMTILLGLKLDRTNPIEIKQIMEAFEPIETTIYFRNIFRNKLNDVVKYDVPLTPILQEYHESIKLNFPNVDEYEKYKPHMTIAHVKSEEGKKYVGKVEPFNVRFDRAVYSYGGRKIEIKL